MNFAITLGLCIGVTVCTSIFCMQKRLTNSAEAAFKRSREKTEEEQKLEEERKIVAQACGIVNGSTAISIDDRLRKMQKEEPERFATLLIAAKKLHPNSETL